MERTDGKATILRYSGEQNHALKKKTLTLEKRSESESDSDVLSLCSLDTRDDSRSRHGGSGVQNGSGCSIILDSGELDTSKL